MKVVINSCYGGFGLSTQAVKRYLELCGKQLYIYKMTKHKALDDVWEFKKIDSVKDRYDILVTYYTTEDQGEVLNDWPSNIFHIHEIPRNDKHLVQVVEELGKNASTKFSYLEVVEVENGRWFRIDEYDGYEGIQYRDIDDEWMLAEENE